MVIVWFVIWLLGIAVGWFARDLYTAIRAWWIERELTLARENPDEVVRDYEAGQQRVRDTHDAWEELNRHTTKPE